jgi:hypothetical protein
LSSFSTTRSLVPNNMPPMPCHRFGETSTGHRKRCPSSASGRSSESLATAEHKSKAESVDLTRRPTVSATTTASTIHRRTKSHTLVKRHAHNNSTSLNSELSLF